MTSGLTVPELFDSLVTLSTLAILKLLSSFVSVLGFRRFQRLGFCELGSLLMELIGTIVLLKPIEFKTEDCFSDPGSKFVSNFVAPLLVVLESIVLAPNDDELVVLDINEGFIGEHEPD